MYTMGLYREALYVLGKSDISRVKVVSKYQITAFYFIHVCATITWLNLTSPNYFFFLQYSWIPLALYCSLFWEHNCFLFWFSLVAFALGLNLYYLQYCSYLINLVNYFILSYFCIILQLLLIYFLFYLLFLWSRRIYFFPWL